MNGVDVQMFSIQCRSSLSLSLDGSPPGATMPQEAGLLSVFVVPALLYDATYSIGVPLDPPAFPPLPLVPFAVPSSSDVAPTAMTPASQPGASRVFSDSFPEAATTMTLCW